MKFTEHTSYKRLKDLVKSAPDLSKAHALSAERVKTHTVSALGLRMNYATERVNAEICEALCHLAKDANVEDNMWCLQDMEMMNYVNNCESERRMVGHTAIRNQKPGKEHSKAVHHASAEYQEELKKLGKFLSTCEYKYMIAVGIGGSYLGALAVEQALKNYQKNDRVLHFASNVDPDKVASILRQVDMKKTIVVIISKSGDTLEIKAQEELLRMRFKEAGLDPKDHFAVVTGKGSPMDKPQAYLEVFYMWDFIGGRYSVSSMVGAVPLAFLFGMKMWDEFLRGLFAMDQHALHEKDPRKNLPLWGALLGIWNRNFLECDTYAIIPYAAGMDHWSLHLQQLFMESNGKSVCKEDGSFIDWDTCPVVWGSVGTEGQHSYYQGIHQGTKVVPIEFIVFKNSQLDEDEIIDGSTNQEKIISNAVAQAIALATGQHAPNHNKYFPGNRQSHILMADRLDAFTLGLLLAYYEHYVAFQGFIWDINSFDQEGVQLGKVLANNVIGLYKEKRERGAMSLNKQNEVARALVDELDKANDHRGGNHHMRSA